MKTKIPFLLHSPFSNRIFPNNEYGIRTAYTVSASTTQRLFSTLFNHRRESCTLIRRFSGYCTTEHKCLGVPLYGRMRSKKLNLVKIWLIIKIYRNPKQIKNTSTISRQKVISTCEYLASPSPKIFNSVEFVLMSRTYGTAQQRKLFQNNSV